MKAGTDLPSANDRGLAGMEGGIGKTNRKCGRVRKAGFPVTDAQGILVSDFCFLKG